MNKLYVRLIPLMLGGICVFTSCNDTPAPVVNVYTPALIVGGGSPFFQCL
ncbi:MAG: hypothetical protein LBO67_09080 [Spirochaetaceae bacterium]|jgi:hypothetical protein|nr:hypothetical protein [Spirochaetaceae bacterium]